MTTSDGAPRRAPAATGPAHPIPALREVIDVVGASDAAPEQVVSALSLVVGLRAELDVLERTLIESAREQRVGWAQISAALGLASRQAAEQRFLRLCGVTARDPMKVRAARRRQQDVDMLHGAPVGALRRAVVAACRVLIGDPGWDERHPRAVLARAALDAAVTAQPGPMYQLVRHAVGDLEAMVASGVAEASAAVFRDLGEALVRAAPASTKS